MPCRRVRATPRHEPKRTLPKDPLHGQPGPACIPQKGFMDTGWLHRPDAALAVALDRVFLDPPVATEGSSSS